MSSTGENIRSYRTKAGISRERLALITGISENSIYLYEMGHRKVPQNKAGIIAKALGVSLTDIYVEDFVPKPRKMSLCWECSRVYKGRGCCWSESFTPVPGWEAVPTVKSLGKYKTDSYNVRRCPLFDRG